MKPGSPSVLLVLGGARSGKSRYAQTVLQTHENVLFLATATESDEEMHAKIARHRLDRPAMWTTIEETIHLADVLTASGPKHNVVLIDCLTLYAANLLAAQDQDASFAPEEEVHRLCSVLRAPPCPVVLVSNEVGSGVVPEYASGRRYRDLLGEINQQVAALASEVILMVAGLPLHLKRQAD